MAHTTVTLEIAGLAVTVPAPEGAEFGDLAGLPDGERHASWSPGRGLGAFMVSTGGGRGHTADGFLATERAHADAVVVVLDQVVGGPAGPARRLVLRSHRHEDRDWVEGDDGRLVESPEREVVEEVAFLFVDGPGSLPLRVGYRVPADAPAEAREVLRRMLDETRVERA